MAFEFHADAQARLAMLDDLATRQTKTPQDGTHTSRGASDKASRVLLPTSLSTHSTPANLKGNYHGTNR